MGRHLHLGSGQRSWWAHGTRMRHDPRPLGGQTLTRRGLLRHCMGHQRFLEVSLVLDLLAGEAARRMWGCRQKTNGEAVGTLHPVVGVHCAFGDLLHQSLVDIASLAFGTHGLHLHSEARHHQDSAELGERALESERHAAHELPGRREGLRTR